MQRSLGAVTSFVWSEAHETRSDSFKLIDSHFQLFRQEVTTGSSISPLAVWKICLRGWDTNSLLNVSKLLIFILEKIFSFIYNFFVIFFLGNFIKTVWIISHKYSPTFQNVSANEIAVCWGRWSVAMTTGIQKPQQLSVVSQSTTIQIYKYILLLLFLFWKQQMRFSTNHDLASSLSHSPPPSHQSVDLRLERNRKWQTTVFLRQSGLFLFFYVSGLWSGSVFFHETYHLSVAPHGGTPQELHTTGSVGLGRIWLDRFHWADGFFFFYVFGRISDRRESASCWTFNETDGHNFYDFYFFLSVTGTQTLPWTETTSSWKPQTQWNSGRFFFCCFCC